MTAVHDEFWGMGLSGMRGVMGEGCGVVDGGMIDAGEMEGEGFYYKGL